MANSPIAEPMTDNQALRYILSELREQNDLALGRYDSVIGSQDNAVDEDTPFVRAANANAIKTVVTNQGDNPVIVSEGGKIVAIVGSLESWVSPLSGSGIISVLSETGDSMVAIATYIRE